MAVTLEGGFPVTNNNARTTTSITVGAGANRLLVVCLTSELAAEPGTAVTFGAAGLTKLDDTQATTFTRAQIWYLVAPATSTANVTCTVTGSSGGCGVACYVFDGVDQVTPLSTAGKGSADSGTTASHTPTGFASGDLTVDVLGLDSTGHTPVVTGSNVGDYATVAFASAGGEFRGSSNTTSGVMSWSWTTSAPNSHIAAIVKQVATAAGVGSAPAFRPLMLSLRKFNKPKGIFLGFPQLDRGTVGAALFNQPLTADAVVATGSMQRQVNKPLTATSVVATASFVKQVNKLLSATAVVVTASMVALKVILKALTATTVLVTASIVKQVNIPRSATTVVVTASIVKQVNKLLTATTVVVTASMVAIKVILRTLTATSVVVSASMVKLVGKPLTATSVVLSASLVKQVGKRLTATSVAVTATLAAIRVFLKTMTATSVVVTASMVRRVNFALSVTVGLTATITKSITHRLTATVSVTGSLVAALVGQLIGPFAASLTVTDADTIQLLLSDASTIALAIADAPSSDASAADSSSTGVDQSDGGSTELTITDTTP
jgi:hypothetical protein